jgi:hypothetical protein
MIPELNNFLWFINNPPRPLPFKTAFINLSAILLSSILSGALIRRAFRKTAPLKPFSYQYSALRYPSNPCGSSPSPCLKEGKATSSFFS